MSIRSEHFKLIGKTSSWIFITKILAMTLLLVISGRGVAAAGQTTMSEFRGEREE